MNTAFKAIAAEPRRRILDLPAKHLDAFPAVRIDNDALFAVVHAKRHGGPRLVDALQTEKAGAIAPPVAQILGTGTDVTESFHTHTESSLDG